MAQYSFVFWNSTGPDRAQRRFLFPLGDLANHKCAPFHTFIFSIFSMIFLA